MNERLPIAEGPEVRRDAAVLLRLIAGRWRSCSC